MGTSRREALHVWTADALIGFVHSTSFLPRAVRGGRTDEFATDLRRTLGACEPDGRLRQRIDSAVELFRRPDGSGYR